MSSFDITSDPPDQIPRLDTPIPQNPINPSMIEGQHTVYHYLDNVATAADLNFFTNNLATPVNLQREEKVTQNKYSWIPVLRTHNINVDKCKTSGKITAIRGVSKLVGVNAGVFYKHLTDTSLMKGWMGNLIQARLLSSRSDLNVDTELVTEKHDVIFTTYR